jgi:hypothetical protein
MIFTALSDPVPHPILHHSFLERKGRLSKPLILLNQVAAAADAFEWGFPP